MQSASDRQGHRPIEVRPGCQPSRCPAMPPASSTSGGHGVLSHAMSPVCETKFDSCALTRQSVPIFSLRHPSVTPCLQNRPRLSETVAHLGMRQQVRLLGSVRVGSCCGQVWCIRVGQLHRQRDGRACRLSLQSLRWEPDCRTRTRAAGFLSRGNQAVELPITVGVGQQRCVIYRVRRTYFRSRP
jgi:predicted metal-binding protein